MHKIKFTKFFDVESPEGIFDNDSTKEQSYHSIGVDLYVPRITEKFLNALVDSNKGSKLIKGNDKDFTLNRDGHILIKFRNDEFMIYKPVTIPTGIGVLIPEDYYFDIRSKSSSFNIGFSLVTGTIDENYTYGMGAQLQPINIPFSIKENQKFAQLVLHKSNKILNMVEVTQEVWENHNDVTSRRKNRNGGFGSTGKFKN